MHGIPSRVWMLLLATGFFLALYYVSLAGAYRAGDMSVAYPLARSSPVIVVSVVALLLGRGNQISAQCVLGIILVVGGCFLIPLKRFGDLRVRNYLNATCGLALLAAVGTSGYSILDDEALRQLRAGTQETVGSVRMTLVYLCLESWAASLWLALFVVVRPNGRSGLHQVLRRNWGHASLAGVAIHLTYLMVLISLAFVKNVSYVVALRQFSIPLGAALGILVLGEPPHPPKMLGLAVMFTGLVLVATG